MFSTPIVKDSFLYFSVKDSFLVVPLKTYNRSIVSHLVNPELRTPSDRVTTYFTDVGSHNWENTTVKGGCNLGSVPS